MGSFSLEKQERPALAATSVQISSSLLTAKMEISFNLSQDST